MSPGMLSPVVGTYEQAHGMSHPVGDRSWMVLTADWVFYEEQWDDCATFVLIVPPSSISVHTSRWNHYDNIAKFSVAASAANGKIIFVPFAADGVGGNGVDSKFTGGALAENGKIIFVDGVGIFDPVDDSFLLDLEL